MKKILLLFLIISVLAGCQKDKEDNFEIEVDVNSLKFKAIPGGSIMQYEIPEGESIYAISITFTNSLGEQKTVSGSYGSTELTIKGFIEKNDAVPAKVSYISMDNRKSTPANITFPTDNAYALTVFENMTVEPYWSGFNVKYNAPENVDGFINIGYKRINPKTGLKEIIRKETKPIEAGENNLKYGDITDSKDKMEVVIWTEDFNQIEAKRETYEIVPKMSKKYDSSKLTYSGDSREYAYKKISWEYLFDGDTKCIQKMKDNPNDYLFMTSKSVKLRPEGIIDLQESTTLAYFRLYSPLNVPIIYNSPASPLHLLTPNHFELYASNDKNAPVEEWVKMGEFYQSRFLYEVFWWNYRFFSPTEKYESLEDLENAEPCYVDVYFDVTSEKYRYLKIIFLETFGIDDPKGGPALVNEMEIYVEK